MKAVVDTNIVFAALANPKGAAYKILQRFFQKQFKWVNSSQTLDEYQGVLSVSQKVSPTSLQIFLHLLQKRSLLIQITDALHVCKDPDDDKFLETAIVGGADFLVTKNLKHFPRKIISKCSHCQRGDISQRDRKGFPVSSESILFRLSTVLD